LFPPVISDAYLNPPVVSPPRLPLLITGIAGVAGYNAFHYFRQRYPGQVIGIRRDNYWPLSGPGIEPCTMTDYDQLARLFERYRFAAVLSSESSCALKSCELDPAMAHRVNVQTLTNLVRVLQQHEARLVHLSIDLVFSGVGQGGYVEGDAPDPVTVYGKTMAEGEALILENLPHAAILRISLPMGVSFNGHAGAIDWIQHRFAKGNRATLYYDEIRTPTYTDCLNELFAALIAETGAAAKLSGLYHAGGPRRLSLYEIAQIVNRVGGYNPDLLMGCPRLDAGPMPPRAGNVSMSSAKLIAALGHDPFVSWPRDQQWAPTDRDWHYRRDNGPPGSRQLLQSILYRRP
jgi:dTDP-4-dehydrorhamnose reductase